MSEASAAHVLVVDDDPGGREAIVVALDRAGHDVVAFADAREALAHVDSAVPIDLVITDIRMPTVDGLELLKELKAKRPEVPVILITGFGSIASSFEAGRLGADDYLEKPLDIHELRRRVAQLLERRARGGAPLAHDEEVLPGIIGRSEAMKELGGQVRLVAPTRATVLVLGESGTGKELVARAVHDLSPASERTFLPLNCAAIPNHLLESELFGHERGAFTGAVARQPGKFELVSDGTLFLDEIGELAADLQAKLLRVLEERRFMRVGGSAPLAFEARLVAASNRNLESMVAEGSFREDLYYRLKVVNLEIPPLRERAGDVRLLASHFLTSFADYYNKGAMSFSQEALGCLEAAPWDGNVRELRNLIESLVVLSHGGAVGVEDLPPGYRRSAPAGEHAAAAEVPPAEPARPPVVKRMDEIERDAILAALQETHGNREQAARRLGIGLRTLQRKIKEYREQGFDI